MVRVRKNDEDAIELGYWDVEPRDVRSDATLECRGMIIDLVTAEFIKIPTGEKCVPVFVIAGNERNIEKNCPGCLKPLSSEKPLFLMDNGEFFYPCVSCDEWKSWVEEEPWMYWLE